MNGLILKSWSQRLSQKTSNEEEFNIRTYQPGDWKDWEILAESTHIDREIKKRKLSFDEIVRKNPFHRPENLFFLFDKKSTLATGALQYDHRYLKFGVRLVNLYAVESSCSEDILHKLCSYILNTIQKHTKPFPGAWSAGESTTVQQVLTKLGFENKYLDCFPLHHDHTDYSSRVRPLYRWHINRTIGESTGDTGDARADESLYKPSQLGTAGCSIQKLYAGDNQGFSLYYTAGSYEIQEGMSVYFWMPGQGSLGTTPQLSNTNLPGFVECKAPDGVQVDILCSKPRVFRIEQGEDPEGVLDEADLIVGPIKLGFQVTKGFLKQGETVSIDIGRHSGFKWKKLSQRKEFSVIIDPGHKEPRMRLPEPVRIRILPREAWKIEVFLPGTAHKDQSVEGVIAVRDIYGNRTDYCGSINIESSTGICSPASRSVSVLNGRGTFHLGVMSSTPIQVAVLVPSEIFNRNPASPKVVSNTCVPVSESDELQLFFGDMHTHDFNSTAEGYPADCYIWGRDEKRLDFQSLPIQVHRWIDNEKWTIAKHMNEYFLDEGKFITFLAFEWQHSSYGDKVVHYLGGDMPYLPVDDDRYANPGNLYEALRCTDAFIISHHPGYELDLHVPGTRWETLETDVDRLLEIWSIHGSSEGLCSDDRPLIKPSRGGGVYEGLRKGVRMGIVAGSDTHTARPGGSTDDVRPYYGGLCGVWAKELTRRSLFEAFRARRTYALTDARIVLRFMVNDHPMGSEIPYCKERRISVEVWAPSEISELQIYKCTDILVSETPNSSSASTDYLDNQEFITDSEQDNSSFYHCRVTLRDGNLAVSSPVWVG